jgi:putative ABC transport system substrate-binding protein
MIPSPRRAHLTPIEAVPRRSFTMPVRTLMISIVALVSILVPCNAQQVANALRIGFVAPQGRSLPLFDAFKQGLADRGYPEGSNIAIEARFAEGQYDRFPSDF